VRGRAEHIFRQPAPIVARIVWEQDGEEHVDTVALGVSRNEIASPVSVFFIARGT
jgi:hypothetical protein